MDMNFILKEMAEGKTADDLAKEFTDALNAATAEIKRQEEEEKIKEKSVKIGRLTKIMEDVIAYMLDYYKDILPKEAVDKITSESYVEAVDALIEEIVPSLPMLIKFQDSFGGINLTAAPSKRSQKPTIKTLSDKEIGDILSQFLEEIISF